MTHAIALPTTERTTLPLRTAFALLGTAALWMICHPYYGVVGDSTIYLGRALADLDPEGIGRDIAFVYDGQSRFSLFPVIARSLVGALGLATTGLLVGALANVCYLAALAALARALAPPRMALSIVLALAVLPVSYGQLDVFYFGETSAIPRPFAEAAVIGMLAALITGRSRLGIALLAIAIALHPIMAMAGIGTCALTTLVRSRRRVVLMIGAVMICAIALGLARAGAPLFDRLLVTPDPEWLGLLLERSPHLFPTLWRGVSFCPIAVQATTILIAMPFLPRPARPLLLSAVVVALVGLVAAAILGDWLHILLALQVQLWRATWLLAVLGGACLAICAPSLWHTGPRGRLILTLLALDWLCQPNPAVTTALCVGTLALRFGRLSFEIERRHAVVGAAIAVALLAVWLAGPINGYIAFLRAAPAPVLLQTSNLLRNNLHTAPLLILLAVGLIAPRVWRRGLLTVPVVASAAVILTAGAATLWDQRTDYGKYVEAGRAPEALASLAGVRGSDVLWIDGHAEAWILLRQAQWMSSQQAVGIVFSRSLAIEWHRRVDSLLALGLARKAIFKPWDELADDDRLRVSADGVAALCRRTDAPGLVIIPFGVNRPALDIPGSVQWPVPASYNMEVYATPEWRTTTGLQAVRCGKI